MPLSISSLDFVEIYLTVPASWDAHKYLLLREVAIEAMYTVSLMNSETQASAIHPVALMNFLMDQKFMICNAGGSSIDIATYNIDRAWGMPKITEVCLRSGSYCGSLFLDVHFHELVRACLVDHPLHLDEASLAHFLLTFSGSEKLHYSSPVDDAKMFHFPCLRFQDSGILMFNHVCPDDPSTLNFGFDSTLDFGSDLPTLLTLALDVGC
ncbi:hypothetical protein BS47DRAFT_1363789 [Hydnum rufescens UP504]|uniref:Uncharacterized protein n=1 Tax=Hydnum rufescens UP504 TaxID=1448309 RepID=A0A9P6AT81_9AGAM|nr:hypothetical protein BS47DRAFT_1363789 [Hydnum rufescens UP504]